MRAYLYYNFFYVTKMPKVKIMKKKMDSGPNISGMVDSLLCGNSKLMDLDVIMSKYLKYKEQFRSVIDSITCINEFLAVYEPACGIILRAFIDGYDKFFALTNENPVEEQEKDAFYENYDAFKESKMCTYLTRIAGRIVKSVKGKWADIQKMAQLGLLTLDIFHKIIDDVSGPYNLAVYYHSNLSIPRDELKKNRELLTKSLKAITVAGREVYALMKKPDIPIHTLFAQFRGCLDRYRKSLRGVTLLFDQIDNGGNIFEENFMKYYKSFVKTGNPMGMFTKFLTDISNQPGVQNKKLVLECGILLKELRKNIQQQAPPSQSVHANRAMSMLDSVLSIIEENPDLGNAEELCEEDLKAMINELQAKFGVSWAGADAAARTARSDAALHTADYDLVQLHFFL